MGVLLEAKPVAPVETTRTPRVRVVVMMGVLLEAKPVAPVETTRTPRVRVVATSGGGGFGKQQMLFAKLSHRTMFFLSRTLKRLRVY